MGTTLSANALALAARKGRIAPKCEMIEIDGGLQAPTLGLGLPDLEPGPT